MKKLFLIVTPFFFSSILKAQSLEGESFKLSTKDGISSFVFEDQNSDGRYIGGQLVKNYLSLKLNSEAFGTFQSNLKKVSKKSEYTIETETYALDKYSWDDSNAIYVRSGDKIGEIKKKEVKSILKL